MNVSRAITAVRGAEKRLNDQCGHESIGADCRRACVIGGMTVIGEVLAAYKRPATHGVHGTGKLGIIVSPMEDCPAGFEEIIVKTPRNRKVKLCRLGPDVRKKYAPPGRPARPGATKGALRRRRIYRRGVDIRPIRRRD